MLLHALLCLNGQPDLKAMALIDKFDCCIIGQPIQRLSACPQPLSWDESLRHNGPVLMMLPDIAQSHLVQCSAGGR